MAFRHPSFHTPQRPYVTPDEAQTQTQSQSRPNLQIQSQETRPVGESQEWVLFSPATESATGYTYTTSTDPTRTAGRSRISDFGSFGTAARSHGYGEADDTDEALEEEEDAEEDGELDSLDSHLHEFRTEPSVYGEGGDAEMSTSVLPTHDGLGGFRVDGMMTGEAVQDHLYAFERFNPRRVKRRRQVDVEAMDEDRSERAAEAERTRRIEEWRMEQSKLLVDEIQRETRRRKLSMSSEKRALPDDREQEDAATLSNIEGTVVDEIPGRDNESFWSRITSRVIQQLMGVDDQLLSIILGESLPEDDRTSTIPTAGTPIHAAQNLIPHNQQYDRSSWEYRLLDRIACELGILINQLSDHPGAFSTYLESQTKPIPYAGLPVIPESARDQHIPSEPRDSLPGPPTVEFQPTLQNTTQPLSIPPANPSSIEPTLSPEDATPRATQPMSREEWEADLDIKMVFRYLRDRFVSRFGSPSAPPDLNLHGTSRLATTHTPETAARAARVRQHHPLVHPSHAHTRERQRNRVRTWRASIPGNGSAMHVRRGSSSCASEGKMSGLGLGAKRSGSSRHYWDFGPSSVGSGGHTGLMGNWS